MHCMTIHQGDDFHCDSKASREKTIIDIESSKLPLFMVNHFEKPGYFTIKKRRIEGGLGRGHSLSGNSSTGEMQFF